MRIISSFLVLLSLFCLTYAAFNNPISDVNWPDPYAYYHAVDGYYYMPRSEDNSVTLYRTETLENWRTNDSTRVYSAGPGLGEVWAPEIHYIDDKFYIYVAMETDGLNENHRMYVLQANDSNDPMGAWTDAVRMTFPEEDYWAIDGTVLEYGNGKLYFIWSGWPEIDSGFPQNLYIAEMCDPLTICGQRVLIKTVDYSWERNGADLIEGPQVLHNAGRVLVVYSASGSWTADYITGFMGIDDLADPLIYDNWWRHDQPVFWRNDEENVYGVGHASLTTSPDGTEPWIIYHAMAEPNAGWLGRTARAQKFSWNPDNSPNFGRPRGFAISLDSPSTTRTTTTETTATQTQSSTTTNDAFNNPISDVNWPDPYAYYHAVDGYYYMPRSEDNGVTLYRTETLENWRTNDSTRVYSAGPGLGEVWAPEIHYIDDKFYIYVAMETDGLNENHRMYVLQANDSNDPMGAWTDAVRMTFPEEDYWAIDGTVLEYGNGKLYFIWSGWPEIDSGFPQNLYIAEMCDPLTICGQRVLIKSVDYSWERNGADLIEGPQVLHNAGRVFVVYSASGSWTADYITGFMGIDDLADPLIYDNWWRHDQPVFWRNDEENVYGVGHASLTTSPDGTEPWIVYHAMAEPNAGWLGRTARAQKFSWNPDNSPNFGRPRGFAISLDSPSTTRTTTTETTATQTQSSSTNVPSSSSWISAKPIINMALFLVAVKLLNI